MTKLNESWNEWVNEMHGWISEWMNEWIKEYGFMKDKDNNKKSKWLLDVNEHQQVNDKTTTRR